MNKPILHKNASDCKNWSTLSYDIRCHALQTPFRKLLEIYCMLDNKNQFTNSSVLKNTAFERLSIFIGHKS